MLDLFIILQGKTQNFQHKAIGLLCRAYYYEAKGLASIFPEAFGNAVPDNAIALACTAVCKLIFIPYGRTDTSQIRCALMEWRYGQFDPIKFTAEAFGSEYHGILEAIRKVMAHKYHGAKFLEATEQWARYGLYALILLIYYITDFPSFPSTHSSAAEGLESIGCDYEVILD